MLRRAEQDRRFDGAPLITRRPPRRVFPLHAFHVQVHREKNDVRDVRRPRRSMTPLARRNNDTCDTWNAQAADRSCCGLDVILIQIQFSQSQVQRRH